MDCNIISFTKNTFPMPALLITKSLPTKVIEIPVKSYVKKVLLAKRDWIRIGDNGEPILKTNHNTLVGKAIFNLIADLPEEFGFPESLPMDKILIELNARTANYYTKYGLWKVFELGVYYERIVQDLMMQHIAAQIRCNRSIAKAVSDFFLMYSIEEGEYERRTAEQLWFKWKRQFPTK